MSQKCVITANSKWICPRAVERVQATSSMSLWFFWPPSGTALGECSQPSAEISSLACEIAPSDSKLTAARAVREQEATDCSKSENELFDVVDTLHRGILIIQKESAKKSTLLQKKTRRPQRQRHRGTSRCSGRCGSFRVSTSRSWWRLCRTSNQATVTKASCLFQPKFTNVGDNVSTTLEDSSGNVEDDVSTAALQDSGGNSSRCCEARFKIHADLSHWTPRFRHFSRSWVLLETQNQMDTTRAVQGNLGTTRANPEQSISEVRPREIFEASSSNSLLHPRSKFRAAQISSIRPEDNATEQISLRGPPLGPQITNLFSSHRNFVM